MSQKQTQIQTKQGKVSRKPPCVHSAVSGAMLTMNLYRDAAALQTLTCTETLLKQSRSVCTALEANSTPVSLSRYIRQVTTGSKYT